MTVRDLIILGCSSQQPTRKRNQGAYLLRWNGEGLLFDPGEGTQRQFIFANVAPPTITRIFISHFHGDHCLGLGSILMRLNLDKVTRPIHCYYPASGKRYFDRLRYGTLFHDTLNVVEHPVSESGLVHQDDAFTIEAHFLDHGVDNVGWRITEPDTRKFYKDKLLSAGIKGPAMQTLLSTGSYNQTTLEQVSYIRPGDTFSVVIDTRLCEAAYTTAKNAKLLLCESTYAAAESKLAHDHHHLTTAQAAQLARDSNVGTLVLTHYSARYLDLTPLHAEACAIFPNTLMAEDLKVIPFPR
ncbi:MAG: ribonuclease Z [Candidatus Obscuribacterales bacterium]